MGTPHNPGSRNCISVVLPASATFIYRFLNFNSVCSPFCTGKRNTKNKTLNILWGITLWTHFFLTTVKKNYSQMRGRCVCVKVHVQALKILNHILFLTSVPFFQQIWHLYNMVRLVLCCECCYNQLWIDEGGGHFLALVSKHRSLTASLFSSDFQVLRSDAGRQRELVVLEDAE